MAELGSLGALGAIPAAIAIAVVVALAFAWLRRRSRVRRRMSQPGESELLRLYERVQRRMRRRRAPPETPREYQEAMDIDLLMEVTEAVNVGVYAGRWPGPERVREIAKRLSSR
jgi:C4-dicarboxylate-specific signal transduction histidine kinase